MLRIIRITLGVLSLIAMTLLFIDVTGFAAAHWSWMAKWQLIPSLLALNLVVFIGLVALTLLAGRVYCSVICPLGLYQDAVNRIHLWTAGKKKRRKGLFKYKPAHTRLRQIFLIVYAVLFFGALVLGIGMWTSSLIEPYSTFGRISTWLFRPAAVEINNLAADTTADSESYIFDIAYHLPLALPLIIVAALTFIIVTIFAWRTGRGYCNSVCPVGTCLGFLSRFSWLKPTIDTDKCTRCGSCARHCKSNCIDAKNHAIDYSRCVACFDCLHECKEGAISFTHKAATDPKADKTEPDKRRRAFLAGGMIVAGGLAAKAVSSATDGGLAPLKSKQAPTRETPVLPPGARNQRWLATHCIACQLCITNCPNGVMRPSLNAATFMQPVLEFNKGFCRPECTKCSDICPTDALQKLDIPVKDSTKIGTAVVDTSLCISAAFGQHCGNCARRCPAGAITMIPVKPGSADLKPLVNAEACIGCGSCEYHCPVGKAGNISSDIPAIHVEGLETQRLI